MFSMLRTRFGIPGVISVMALVFAMIGGAYAASNSSGGGKATASAKAKKGPRGPKGATGPAGPQGPAGPAGANGKDGANGANGAPGAPGANGKSVLSGSGAPAGALGGEGDFYIRTSNDTIYGPKVGSSWGSPTALKGESGEDGSPWTAGGTLPSGSTETGAWVVPLTTNPTGNQVRPVLGSFAIPLAAPLDEEHVHFINEAGEEVVEAEAEPEEVTRPPTSCPGSVEEPKADSGNLCIYAQATGSLLISNQSIKDPATFQNGASLAGAMGVIVVQGAFASGNGTWAVTG